MAAWEITICNLVFQGYDNDYILEHVFNIYNDDGTVDEKKRKYYKGKITKFLKTEKFIQYYRTIVTEYSVHGYGKAVNKLFDQINCGTPWLENKAANDVLTRFGNAVMGESENTITVKVEGMPELGTPENSEG